jgi:hypothetical protein
MDIEFIVDLEKDQKAFGYHRREHTVEATNEPVVRESEAIGMTPKE